MPIRPATRILTKSRSANGDSWVSEERFDNARSASEPAGHEPPAPCVNSLGRTNRLGYIEAISQPRLVIRGVADATASFDSSGRCAADALRHGTCIVVVNGSHDDDIGPHEELNPALLDVAERRQALKNMTFRAAW